VVADFGQDAAELWRADVLAALLEVVDGRYLLVDVGGEAGGGTGGVDALGRVEMLRLGDIGA
jgi:hypothetical protein